MSTQRTSRGTRWLYQPLSHVSLALLLPQRPQAGCVACGIAMRCTTPVSTYGLLQREGLTYLCCFLGSAFGANMNGRYARTKDISDANFSRILSSPLPGFLIPSSRLGGAALEYCMGKISSEDSNLPPRIIAIGACVTFIYGI
jgi:hypothetical protein